MALLLAVASCSGSGKNLPLVEVSASGPPPDVMAFFISGDGNWAEADRDFAKVLSAHGIPMVGLEARTYLTRFHPDPDEAAADAEDVIRKYLSAWDRDRLVLVGYSRGADMMPFVMDRLPADLRSKVVGMVLIGPVPNASFEFHLRDLVENVRRPDDVPLLPEVERLAGLPMLCIRGEEEHDTLCREVSPDLMDITEHKGGHVIHDGTQVADSLIDWLEPLIK